MEGMKNNENRKKILIIEDDVQVQKMLNDMLDRAGYETRIASDGDEGLTIFKNEITDLVITDIIMPNKEGIETIMELRQLAPNIKIIAISGGGRNEPESYLYLAEQLGAHRTLPKPIRRAVLLQAIQELIGE